MQSGDKSVRELDVAGFRRALELLARMGVFHVALGGGEALLRGELFELASYARELGLVPNLTISGTGLTHELARRMTVFGQVNVSLDGVGDDATAFRTAEQVARAEAAIPMLCAAGVSTGINCVLGRRNFAGIAALFEHAATLGCNELELLRFKPVGRGRALDASERTSYEQNVALVPLLSKLSEEHGLPAKVDCSFVPMMCYHRPPLELLETTATYGCEAGNVLLGVGSDGAVSGCSFLPPADLSIFELPERWELDPSLLALRSWPERAPEPCRGCDYLLICKGGCHAVAAAVSRRVDEPDPDCPWVVEHARAGGAR
jgi:radical SAM protein with 4Fe4S-binding SPASM domain